MHRRLFVAVSMPDTFKEAGQSILDRLQAARFKLRWMKAENMHLTLKFIGDTEASRLDEIKLCLEESLRNAASFTVKMGNYGYFDPPKILWWGIQSGNRQLSDLSARINSGLEEIGFAKEEREFKPHLTLGRGKGKQDMERILAQVNEVIPCPEIEFNVNDIFLFESHVNTPGPKYRPLGRYPLR